MKFSTLYGIGAAMGWTAREVDALSLWELSAASDGYARANGGEQQAEAPSYSEHLAMVEKLGS